MIITVKESAIAKKSDCIPHLRATHEAKATTTAACTEGIPPLQRARLIFTFQVLIHSLIHFKITATTKEVVGTKMRLS